LQPVFRVLKFWEMEAKEWLMVAVSGLFILQALVHIFKPLVLEKYAVRRGFLSAGQAVRLAGLLLLAGGIALWIEAFRFYAGLVLAVFTLVAAFSMHKFWDETDGELQFLELLHFLKNLLIVAVLIFLAIGES
jgi:putative oxidoreductase